MYHAAVLTVSDRVSRGERPDEGGPLVAELLKNAGYEVVRTDVVPDEQAQIEAALRQMADDGDIQLLVTTGGTGFAPRDVTPEATLAVCDRLTPGIPEAMRYASMQITSRAMLSRAQAGIRKGDLDPEPPRLPQGGQGESGGGAARHQSRSGNALRPPRRLRQADGLTRKFLS